MMKKQCIKCLFFVLVVCCNLDIELYGQNLSKELFDLNSPDNLLYRIKESNHSAIGLLPLSRFVELTSSYYLQGHSGIYKSYDGNENRNFQGLVTGFVNKEKSAAMGVASYTNGVSKNIRWSDVSDNLRISPYKLSDTTKGNRFYEQYYMKGSIAHKFNKGIVGLKGGYRAEGTYRIKDPRALTTVSDIDLEISCVFPLNKYYTGASVNVNSYLQNISVRNFQDDRKDKFYLQLGFGLYHSQISGSYDLKSLDYRGSGVGFSSFIIPKDSHSGIVMEYSFNYDKTNTRYEKITPAILEANKSIFFGGYKWASFSNSHLFGIRFSNNERIGTERIYETIVVNEETQVTDTRFLTKSTKYSDYNFLFAVEYLGVLNLNSYKIFCGFNIGKTTSGAKYKTTNYEQMIEKGYCEISLGVNKYFKNSTAGFTFSGALNKTFDEKLICKQLSEVSIGQIIPDHNFASASFIKTGIGLRYLKLVSQTRAVAISGNYILTRFRDDFVNQFQFKLLFII